MQTITYLLGGGVGSAVVGSSLQAGADRAMVVRYLEMPSTD